jgi:hypothetical protein
MGNYFVEKTVESSMRCEEQLDLQTMERVKKQSALLLRLYEAELAKDPTSLAAESSRSNLIALRHTIAQLYGDDVSSMLDGQEQIGWSFGSEIHFPA